MDHRDRDRRHHHFHRDYHRPLRYAPPPPPSLHRPQYIDVPNPNLYIPRHQNPNFPSPLQTLSLTPTSPPPLPSSYNAPPVPLPPPPPPPPHSQSEFTFYRHKNLMMESPYRESHGPHGVPPGNWAHRLVSPNQASYRRRHESDVYSRFRDDEVVAGLKYSHQGGLAFREDVGFNVFNSDGSSSNLRCLEYMDGLDPGREYNLGEEHRLVDNRQVRLDFGDSFPGFREFGVADDGGDFRIFTPTPVEQEAYYGSEFERFNSNDYGGRNGTHDYDLTPKHLGQKKSAFLRLQLPKRFYRSNGDDSRTHYENMGSFRGKGHLVSSDSTKKDRKEGNPVELDVSFKLNSLVAKPIVAPATASVKMDPHADLMRRNNKLKSAVVSNKNKLLKTRVVLGKDNTSLPLKSAVVSNNDDAGLPLNSAIELNKDDTSLMLKSAVVASKDNSSLLLKSAITSSEDGADSPLSNHKKTGLKSSRLTSSDNCASDPVKVLNSLEEAITPTENEHKSSSVQKTSKEANTLAQKRKVELNGKKSSSDIGCLDLESGNEAVSIGEVDNVRSKIARVCDKDKKKVQGKTNGAGEGNVYLDLQSGNEAVFLEKINGICPRIATVCDEAKEKAQGTTNGLGKCRVLDGHKVCPGEAYTLKDGKKKRVVKKLAKPPANVKNVKTVKNHDILAKADCSSASGLKHDNSVKAGGTAASGSDGAKHSRDISTTAGVEMSVNEVHYSDRAHLELSYDLREEKSQAVSLEEHGNEIDNGRPFSIVTKRDNNGFSQQTGLLVDRATESDKLTYDDEMQEKCVLVSKEDIALSTAKASVREESGPHCEKLCVGGKSLSVDNTGQYSTMQCSDSTSCLNSEKSIACKDHRGTDNTSQKGITSSISGNNVVRSPVKPIISGSGCLDTDGKSSSSGFFASLSDEVAIDSRNGLETDLDNLHARSKEQTTFSGSGTDSVICMVSSSMNNSSQPVVGAYEGSSNDMFSIIEEKQNTSDFPSNTNENRSKVDLPISWTSDAIQEPAKISLQSPSQSIDSLLGLSGTLDDGLHSSSNRHDVSDGNYLLWQFSQASTAGEIDKVEDEFSFPITKRRKILPKKGYSSPRKSFSSGEALTANTLASSVSCPLNSVDIPLQPEVAVATLSLDTMHATNLSQSLKEKYVSHNHNVTVQLPNTEGMVRYCIGNDVLRLPDAIVGDDLDVPSAKSQQTLVQEQKEDSGVVNNVRNNHYGLNNGVIKGEENVSSCTPEKQVTSEQEQVDFRSTKCHSQTCVLKMPRIETQNGDDFHLGDDSPSVSTSTSMSANADGHYNYSTINEDGKSLQDGLSNIGSLHTFSLLKTVGVQILDSKVKPDEISDVKVSKDDERPAENLILEDKDISNAASLSCDHQVDYHLGGMMEIDHPSTGQAQDSHGNNNSILKPARAEPFGNSNSRNHVIQRPYPGKSSHMSLRASSSLNIAPRPHTWHRAAHQCDSTLGNKPLSSILSVKRHFAGKMAKSQSTSYVRKGNSLVRKPSIATASTHLPSGTSTNVYRLNPQGVDNPKKMTSSRKLDNINDTPNLFQSAGLNASFERPITPLSDGSKISKMPELLPDVSIRATSDTMNPTKSNNVLKSSENNMKVSQSGEAQSGAANYIESQSEKDFAASTLKNLETNQLAVTSNRSYPLILGVDKCNNASSSDSYYKRKKNQLIRTSLDNQVMQSILKSEEVAILGSQKVEKAISDGIVCRRQSHKAKLYKPSKSSLVWTLHGTQSSRSNGSSLNRPTLFPQLFPWKRVTYWRSFLQNLAFNAENKSLSAISRRLVLSRKRNTIYTRSMHGLSLRISKVLGVGGSSLKWSKSIERRSKKANEEATLAVAAVEREKRQQGNGSSSVAGSKSKKHSQRIRVFRIGCVRYKMDTSKGTLQRTSDDESSCTVSQSKKDAKISYVPRRLIIGNDEYVRIGNGNQLVRNPKKRTRVLASEKVRWSLHTARLRLAKKRKYCQFFTRFGKCNKDDGKCPYIHDPSKIAVCTKFLNGLCSNKDCKLTHEVIPERMPDCSYFLQGLCANRNCPYRHVNVNPNSPSCEGFLRGYCADGNECRKKHTYVCPAFEATGSCPQGSKCKLHHPKAKTKGKKRKRSGERKNALGRYFGVREISGGEEPLAEDRDHACPEGIFPDYISLNIGV